MEVETSGPVAQASNRLADAGLATRVEDNTTCCYAVRDEVWVPGPGNEPTCCREIRTLAPAWEPAR